MFGPRQRLRALVERLIIGAMVGDEGVEIRHGAPDVHGEIGAVVGAHQLGTAKAPAAREQPRPFAGRPVRRLELGTMFLAYLKSPDDRDHVSGRPRSKEMALCLR